MATKQKPKSEVTLTVKCPSCGKKRDIKPGEIKKNDFPMCDVCYMPMMPHQACARQGGCH